MIFTRVRGIPQTKAALVKANIIVEAAKPLAARAGAEPVARAMIDRAPRRTGRLVASISVDESSGTAKIGADAPYDRFVQKGTRYMAAQPYGQDAAEASESAVVAAMAVVFAEALDRGF